MLSRLAHEFGADIRHAVRQMCRQRTFTATVVLTLGLGIGATVAFLSVTNALLVRPLPYAHEDRIRVFWMDFDWRGEEYDFVRERPGVFESIAAFSDNASPYHPSTRAAEGAQFLGYVVATSSLFDVLGTRAYLGRTLDAQDDKPAAPQVIVIGYGMWKQDFGGDAHIIGHQILIDSKPVTIVGVMPKGFYFPTPDFRAWRPLQLDPSTAFYHDVGWLTILGRARAGAAPALVQSDMQRIARSLGTRFTYTAAFDKTKKANAQPVRAYLLGNVRGVVVLLLGAVILLLIIACANAAAIILARTSDRTTELAVRAALGAGQHRIARQIVTEAFVLALGAALLGTAIAVLGFGALVSSLPIEHGFGDAVTMGWMTFVAAFVLALVVAIGISIAPIRHILRGRLDATVGFLRERSDAGLRRSTRRVHDLLVGGQVMLAVLLIAGATLLIRSVEHLRGLDLGFDPHGVMTFTLVPSENESADVRRQFFRDIVGRVNAMPGVTAAGLTNRLPMRDDGFQGPVLPEGHPELAGPRRPNSFYRTATPALFRALGIRLREGRAIDSTDLANTLPVTVISESFARHMWPNESAIGKHITTGYTGTMISRTIVGVAAEVRQTGITGDSPFAMWVPVEQHTAPEGGNLVVRSTIDPASLTTAIRRATGQLDPQVAVARVETMDQVLATALAQPLRLRFFLTLFGALALALGGIGVYGVVSYSVARRRAEYAIRVALGASPRQVLGDVVRRGLTPVALGTLAGVAGAFASGRVLVDALFGVQPTDTLSIGTAAVLLLVAGIFATLPPALRAGRTNPASAMRAG